MPRAAPNVCQPIPAPKNRGDFLLVSCQGGAEAALCRRQQEILPALAKGAWRRGLVTFRLAADAKSAAQAAASVGFDPPDNFFPDLIFARAVIRSFGQVVGASDEERIEKLRLLAGHSTWDNVHVWHRDPRTNAASQPVRCHLLKLYEKSAALPAVAQPGDLVLDCVIDSIDRWWVGWHRADTPSSCWPGGVYPGVLPEDKVSRAWLKLDEALATFAVALERGNRACELGAAPGGACQRLLEAGLMVVGIDPALVADAIAADPRFEQWRMRARDVRIRMFRGFDWIVTDMNIDPKSTLESIERIVTAPGVRPAGIIATLKLPEWSRSDSLPAWLALFRTWGFQPQARQLSSGGREVCVVALRDAARRKSTARQKKSRQKNAQQSVVRRARNRATHQPDQ